MIVYRCPGCGSDVRTEVSDKRNEYKEVILDSICDFCKLVTREQDVEEKLLEAIFGGSR